MTEREQFQAEYRKRSDRDDDDVKESLRLGEDGEYIYDGTWTAFYWWQAARAQSPQVPEGMALVPLELMEKCTERLIAGAKAFQILQDQFGVKDRIAPGRIACETLADELSAIIKDKP